MAIIKKVFEMEDLDCANCARKMEEAVAKIDGVQSCTITFMTQKMTLEYDGDNEKKIFKEITKTIKKVEPDTSVNFD